MLFKEHCWRYLAIVIFIQMAFSASEAHAGAWSDYVEVAGRIVDADNRRLNSELRPAESAEVRVQVEVRQTGVIKESKVIESSGNKDLDAAAIASLEKLAELPTPPASVYFKQFFTPLMFTYTFDSDATADVVPVQVAAEEPDDNSVTDAVADQTPPQPNKVVLALQSALIEAGYDPGPVDGFYGNGTADAIRAFQRDRDLEVDGIPTAALLDVVLAEDEEEPEQDVPVPAQTAAIEEPPDKDGVSDNDEVSGFIAPKSGAFSLNRDIVEDYEYLGDRQFEDY